MVFGVLEREEELLIQEEYCIRLYCPDCLQELVTRYDYLKMETVCAKCGILLRAPPEYGIIYPDVIRKKVRCGGTHDDE